MKPDLASFLLIILVFLPNAAHGQWAELPSTGSPQNHLEDRTTLVGQSGMGPFLRAELVDEESNAKRHRAVIRVQTDGVTMVEPSSSKGKPMLDEAHLQYRLDTGAAHNTVDKTWTFENLSPGEHTIWIALMANDKQILGEKKTLTVKIP